MDELALIERATARVPDPSNDALARMRRELDEEIDRNLAPAWERPRPRRRVSRRRALVGSLAALVAIGAGAVVLLARSFPSSDMTGPRVAAGAAADGTVGAIPAGEYLYVRTSGFNLTGVTPSDGVSYSYVVPFTHEIWVGADGSGRIRTVFQDATFLTPENAQVFHDAGLPVPDQRRPNDRDTLLGAGEIDMVDLSALPVDVDALRTKLYEEFHVAPGWSGEAAQFFEWISDWGFAVSGPVANRQALVSVMSSTPGATTETIDGMTVVSADHGGVRAEFWFDPDTGDLRRTRRVLTDATIVSALHAPNGTVLGDTQVEVSGIVPSTDATP